ncbi:MAG: hypothetical protein IJG53_06910, partial [Eggerthellaceae bacterium]|nr:hypothetical protein [Eggerthellaceae bacterium]
MPAHAFDTDFTAEDGASESAMPAAATEDEVELIAHPVEDPWSDKEAFTAAGSVVSGRHAAHAHEGAASYEEPEAAASAGALRSTRTGGRHGAPAGHAANHTALARAEAAQAPSLKVRMAKKTRRRNARIAAFTSIAAVLVALAGVYAYGVFHFTDHLMPNTVVAGVDISGMEVSRAKEALDQRVDAYKCSISGSNYYLLLRGDDIDFTADTQGLVDRIMSETDRFRWPFLLSASHSY